MAIRSIGTWNDHSGTARASRPGVESAERARRAATRAIMSKATADPREALRAVVARGNDSLAALSRMIGKSDGYLGRFLNDGVPVALAADDHRRLAEYFGLTERELGIRDLWCARP